MNKKLFSWKALAGVALLAAFSMTSCQSDDAIDLTNPSGVKPTNIGSIVGGTYDWEVTPAKYTDFDKATAEGLWAKAAKEVMEYLDKNKKNTINVLVNVEGFKLTNETFVLPDFWKNDGTGAKDKVVNITLKGKFKNADFERADVIAKKGEKFPVKIDTQNLGGAEVNFTFDADNFDLSLLTTTARSTITTTGTIGWMYAEAAEKKSALELKSGVVEGLDIESTGDFEGAFTGVWSKNGNDIEVTAKKGIQFGKAPYAIYAKDLFVEKTALVKNQPATALNGNTFKLNSIKLVAEDVTVTFEKNDVYVGTITGVKEAKDFIACAAAGEFNLNYIDEINKVTVLGDVTLTKDIFTDVTFKDAVTISSDKINTFDKVTFNDLTIEVPADDQTLTFNGVKFAKGSVTMVSTKTVDTTVATISYDYYQWVIDETDPAAGKWVMYKSDDKATNDAIAKADKAIKEYNKDKTEYTFLNPNYWTTMTAYVDYFDKNDGQLYAGIYASADDKANIAAAKNLIKIGYIKDADTANLKPANCNVILDKDCTFDGATTVAALNSVWGNKGTTMSRANAEELTWYNVTFNGEEYKWEPTYNGAGVFTQYILIKK